MTDQLMILPASALLGTVVKRRGHAARPGTGPAGETCGSCEAYTRVEAGAGTYRKCLLAKPNWTCGPGSDIRKKDPACSFWKATS